MNLFFIVGLYGIGTHFIENNARFSLLVSARDWLKFDTKSAILYRNPKAEHSLKTLCGKERYINE